MKPNPLRVSNHLTVPVWVENKAAEAWNDAGAAENRVAVRRNALLVIEANMVKF